MSEPYQYGIAQLQFLRQKIALESSNSSQFHHAGPAASEQPDLNLRLAPVNPHSRPSPLARSASFLPSLAGGVNRPPLGRGQPLPRSCSLPTVKDKTISFMEFRRRFDAAQKRLFEQRRQPPAAIPSLTMSPSRRMLPSAPLIRTLKTRDEVLAVVQSAAGHPVRSEPPPSKLGRALDKIFQHGQASGSKTPEGAANSSAEPSRADRGKQPLLAEEDNSNPITSSEKAASKRPVPVEEETYSNLLSKRMKSMVAGALDDGSKLMKKMPSVSAPRDGPQGKKIEGFLHRCKEGEVSIVCICHGTFLTPAEFIQHAGGTDSSNPMKHITVSVSPISF